MRELDNLRAINVPLVNDYIIGIRPNHAPLIAETKQGKIICRTKTSETYLELHGGVLEVREMWSQYLPLVRFLLRLSNQRNHQKMLINV